MKTLYFVAFVALLATSALGGGYVLARITEGIEEAPSPDRWYISASLIAPVDEYGSAVVTVMSQHSRGEAAPRSPGGIESIFLFLPWNVTDVDLGDRPLSTLNDVLIQRGDVLGFFQVNMTSGNETAQFNVPHWIVNRTGVPLRVESIVMVAPQSEKLLALGMDGSLRSWELVVVDARLVRAWVPVSAPTLLAVEE